MFSLQFNVYVYKSAEKVCDYLKGSQMFCLRTIFSCKIPTLDYNQRQLITLQKTYTKKILKNYQKHNACTLKIF